MNIKLQLYNDKKSMKPQQQQCFTHAALVIQKHFRGHKSRQQTKKLYKRLNDRRKIIQELVVTEEKYIHDLSLIISDFMTYLFNGKVINDTQNYLLFANIDAIRKLNEQFFIILHCSFMNYWHYKVIFDEVKKQIYFFKIYFEYLNNFTNAMAIMKDLKQNNSKFSQFLTKIRKNPTYGNLDLEDYLIKPVQRLPKYVLLLKLLLKKTPMQHPDYQNIKKVLQGFEEVNLSNNQKLNKIVNNFKLAQLEKQAKLPFHIAEPGTEFILEQNITILTTSNKTQDVVMHLLNNRVILTKRTKTELKFVDTVEFRFGVSLMQNEDQELYENCFTLQSIDGDSITFLCQGEEEKMNVMEQIQKQITSIEKKTLQKYSALQNNKQICESFLRKITRFDLLPQICVLGTEQRTDKMLKYTTYIIEVKVKNIRQKIFLRYSQLLEVQSLINLQFPKLQIKQSLYKTTWLLNHKPKTIEQRKMSIQRFLKEVLSKPQIIESGQNVLSKLGLPEDLYSLPEKLKFNESIMKKSIMIAQNKMSRGERDTRDKEGLTLNSNNTKSRKTYRLSIFEDLSDDQQKIPRKHSLHENVKGSTSKRKPTIEQILFANQLNLGHYIRFSQNLNCLSRNKIRIQILLPWIQNPKGFVKKTIQIMENQRVALLINKLVKQINLNYYKDFRLFMEKQYSQRVLDDDEIIGKVQRELFTGRFCLVFKKMIFIDREAEENQIKSDRLRLKLIASQIVYEVKKSKYRLNYSKFLTLSVLIGIIQHDTKLGYEQNFEEHEKLEMKRSQSDSQIRMTFQKPKKSIQPDYKSLAISTRQLLANPYASFFQNDKVWVKDFTSTYKDLHLKLRKIARGNSMLLKSVMYTQQQEAIWTSVVQLSYIAIIDQVKHNSLFGSMGYVVQISENFREQLIDKLEDEEEEDGPEIDAHTKENRNVWLIVKCSGIYLYGINLAVKLWEISYDKIDRVICYPSSIILAIKKENESKIDLISHIDLQQSQQTSSQTLKPNNPTNTQNSTMSSLKLKTTSSYSIRELLNYYKNFNDLNKKMQQDQQYSDSIIEMVYENERILQSGEKSVVEYEEQHV